MQRLFQGCTTPGGTVPSLTLQGRLRVFGCAAVRAFDTCTERETPSAGSRRVVDGLGIARRDRGVHIGMLELLRPLNRIMDERVLEDIPQVLGQVELALLAELLRDLVEVLVIAVRDDDRLDPVPERRERFLLKPADRQHLAPQGYLAGH